jgi:hypothetical protein
LGVPGPFGEPKYSILPFLGDADEIRDHENGLQNEQTNIILMPGLHAA